MSYRDQFLVVLRNAGSKGVPNYELSQIALQYNFVIHQLRKAGYNIRRRQVSKGTSYYILEEKIPVAKPAPSPRQENPKLFNVQQRKINIWEER